MRFSPSAAGAAANVKEIGASATSSKRRILSWRARRRENRAKRKAAPEIYQPQVPAKVRATYTSGVVEVAHPTLLGAKIIRQLRTHSTWVVR